MNASPFLAEHRDRNVERIANSGKFGTKESVIFPKLYRSYDEYAADPSICVLADEIVTRLRASYCAHEAES
jgi:hypothetical protein